MRDPILFDARLSDRARILGLYVATKGEGAHEISSDEFARVAHGAPSQDTVGRALRELEVHGYLTRQSGGHGRSDRFTYIRTPADLAGKVDPHTRGPKDRSAQVRTYPALDRLLCGPKSDSPGLDADLKAPVGGGRGGVAGREQMAGRMDEERAREISEKADGAIQGHGDLLKGCRGALRDYLAQRVDSATRQYAYVQKIAGWREGTERNVFQKPNGTGVPPPEQTRFLAAALNELLATDEGKMKWPVGDIRNLRTKVRILVENDYGDKPWNNGGVGQASGREPGRHPKSGRRPDGHAYEG